MPLLSRPPAVSGSFYPGDPRALARTVDSLLARAPHAGRSPKAIVAPHAGYVYSGPIAATAFARWAALAPIVRRVVLLGPAHYVSLRGCATVGVDRMATPLGEVEVDREAAAAVGLVVDDRAHAREHSLEVELPFLARVLPNARVVPVVVGDARPAEVAALLESLRGGRETVVAVSSDLSHYLPYDVGHALDEETAARIVALDERPIAPDEACGAAPLNGLLAVARSRAMRVELLDLRSSGDTAGDRESVVGYGAFAFHETRGEVRYA